MHTIRRVVSGFLLPFVLTCPMVNPDASGTGPDALAKIHFDFPASPTMVCTALRKVCGRCRTSSAFRRMMSCRRRFAPSTPRSSVPREVPVESAVHGPVPLYRQYSSARVSSCVVQAERA